MWALDEHRLGLKPVLRRVWAPRGQRPVASVHQRYEWLYLAAFVHPRSGMTHWLILPTVNAAVVSLALAHFAKEVGAGDSTRVVLVLDQAGYHIGKEVAVPDGIELVFLPPYSPELQPVERLWPLTNEGVANRVFADLDALEAALGERCVALSQQPDRIRAHTCYHWWPDAA